MAVASVGQGRALLRALLSRVAASGAERAARRHVQRAGNVAFQDDSLGTLGDLGIRNRNRRKQGLRVGVDGAVIELIRVRCLYYSSKVHNSDSVRNMSDYQQVVRDEEISNTELFLQLFKHIDDLRLDGNVQRGYGFVADDEFGIYSQRSRDTDTLSLAAGELVDVSCRMLRVQSDQFHEAEDLLSALCFVGIEFMDIQGLANDLFDRHTGVQRGIGILENRSRRRWACRDEEAYGRQ